ncbi:hypothetical protein [Sanyastnella coralliicola]|uniref:hypothetical protein n=1 Tax=Sanyastnella coralliicola TaxID=3069118 RepID=UPI0027BA431E|nr:hypothetical protein [Longitalea sp. SCSIO 12813]
MVSQRMIQRLGALLLIIAPLFSLAQGTPKTEEAVRIYQTGDLMAARTQILDALQSSEEKDQAYTWFVKGFIFKEIFKQIEKGNPFSENREVAVEAILHSMKLDGKGEYRENNVNALKYLSLTYYNDAVLLTKSLNESNLEFPLQFYQRYKELYVHIEPAKDHKEQDLEFYKNMGKACRILYEKEDGTKVIYFDKMVDFYKMALEVAPEDFQANYNLAVNYYNKGVYKIRKIDHNTEIFELIRIQDECVALFKQALPFMLAAHEAQPEHADTLKGLMAIYRSLSDRETAMAYQEELEKLITDGKPQD